MKYCENDLTVWHMSGEKYFGFLQTICNANFINPHFIRHIIGKGPFATSKKNYKILKLNKVNIVCLAPFDINVLYFCLVKHFFQRDSKLVLHTSYPEHIKGKVFKNRLFKLIWMKCVDKYFEYVVTPIPSIVPELRYSYNIPVKTIFHPITIHVPENRVSNFTKEEGIRVGFLGEKTEKKGYERFIKLAQVNSDIDFYCAGPGVVRCSLPNVVNLPSIEKENVASFLLGLDILLVPSKKTEVWEELFGIVIIEAVYCNVKVIASDHIGPRMLKNDIMNLTLLEDADEIWQNLDLKSIASRTFEKEVNLDNYKLERIKNEWNTFLNNL